MLRLTVRLTLAAAVLLILLPLALAFASPPDTPLPAPRLDASVLGADAAQDAAEMPDASMGDGGQAVAMLTPEAAQSEPIQAVGAVVDAVKTGNWRYAASLLLALVMLAIGKVRDRIPLFSGDRGGAILVGLLAMFGAMASALASSAALDWRLFLGAAGVMWTAVGGYTWMKRLLWPSDQKEPPTGAGTASSPAPVSVYPMPLPPPA